MNLLLDTHLLLWTVAQSLKLSQRARLLIADTANTLFFSSASIWEIAIKSTKGRPDFAIDPKILRQALLEDGYLELPIRSEHAIAVRGLPLIHNDPFDRILVAQAAVEGFLLLTADRTVASYGGLIELV
jgi:PIN domain nuclease of toxin-antitoxin system